MKKTTVIVGIDEAGRGALAGPVVAGACLFTKQFSKVKFIQDSKALTPEQREEAFLWIEENCTYAYGLSTAEEVDSLGILGATEKAMQEAVAALSTIITPSYLLVDGRDKFWFDYPHTSIIKGDQKEPCISAASIVAKVTRDRMMCEYAKEFSHYSFELHKGYGVPNHYVALKKHGVSSLHRKTFLKSILSELPSFRAPSKTTRKRQPRKSVLSKAVRV